jgi:hypothetical protein
MTTRSCLLAAVALLGSFLLAGCGSITPPADQPTPPAAPSRTQPAQTGSGASVTHHRLKPWYRRGMRTIGFQSPTGNIRCALQTDDHTQLLCKTLNNENAIDLDNLIDADPNVTATIPAEPTLTYGRVWSSPNFYCWSRFTAVTCRSLYSGNGFAINRAGVTLLIWDTPVLASTGTVESGSGDGSSSTFGSGSSSGAGNDSGSDFCGTHACIDNFDNGSGYIVQCVDGMWSHSGGLSGACSYHGGEG